MTVGIGPSIDCSAQPVLARAMVSTSFMLASLSASILSCAFYCAFTRLKHNIKQKCWLVTLLSSMIMSCGCLPFLWDFCSCGGTIRPIESTKALARVLCGSFQGFLIADLVLGTLFYRQQVTVLFGWVHHIAYALLMPYISCRGWEYIFALCLSMEIPIFYLSVSILWPQWRNDLLYIALFFLFRINLHATLLIRFSTPKHAKALVQGSSIPSILLASAFALHVSSFVQNVKKLLGSNIEKGTTYIGWLVRRSSSSPSLSQLVLTRRWAFTSTRGSYNVSPNVRKIRRRELVLLTVPLLYVLAKLFNHYRLLPVGIDSELGI